jgi:hypothetical protein
MKDPAFQRGEIDIQLLERRADLIQAAAAPDHIQQLAIVAALAEAEARQSRRPPVSSQADSQGEWARVARSEAHR